MVADPLFEDAGARDFRLKPGSPAAKIGFQPFDFTKAGVYGSRAWIALANSVQYPPVEFAPPAPPLPPLTLHEDFELLPLNAEPPRATVSMEKKGDAIAVTNETAATGKQCLKFQDAPGLAREFTPHMYYSPGHLRGLTRCAFDLKLSKGAVFYHEWRDNASAYRKGPHLTIQDGKLQAPGRPLIDVPTDRWLHVEISARLGEQSTGTWALRMALLDPPANPAAAGSPEAMPVLRPLGEWHDLKLLSSDWRELHWLGFVSNGTVKAETFLDNLELTNQAE